MKRGYKVEANIYKCWLLLLKENNCLAYLVFRVIKAVIVHVRVISNLNKKENLILDLIYFCSSNI